jgi:hypothetical protein
MKRSIIRGLVLSLFFLWACFPVSLFAQTPSVSEVNLKSKPPPWTILTASPIEIQSSNRGVRIEVNKHPLPDILLEISRQTGIHFRVDPSLENHTLTASIQAPDWKTAIETLLEEISTVTLWSKSSRMGEVILLGMHDGYEVLFSVPNGSNKSSKNSQNAPLTKKQLRNLAKGPFRSPLSPELLETPAYREFLHNQGIETKEDLQQLTKAMRVRKAAKLQLRKLQEKARTETPLGSK